MYLNVFNICTCAMYVTGLGTGQFTNLFAAEIKRTQISFSYGQDRQKLSNGIIIRNGMYVKDHLGLVQVVDAK